jgi:probable F420-dependent oxidoreductase
VKIGVVFSQADSGTDPLAIRRFARTAEAAGFDHLMAYDHVLGASPERLGPGPFGSFPSAPYTSEHVFHEILVLFSHLTAVTERLRFVTSVLLLPQRETALAAKQIATLELLSGGRLDLTVGIGWNRVEYESLGFGFPERRRRLEEQIDLLRLLWTRPLVTFEGRFHRLDRVGINPLPSRPIPIWMGTGASAPALRSVVRKADGWMPLLLPGLDADDVASAVERLRHIAAQQGRDPASLPIHGRVYLGDGWQREVVRAVELGFDRLSVGFNRLAHPGRTHDEHLEAILAVKPELDRLAG